MNPNYEFRNFMKVLILIMNLGILCYNKP